MSAASAAFTTCRMAPMGLRLKTMNPMSGQARAGKPPLDLLWGAWQAEDSLLYWDESDGLSLLPESSPEVAIACRDIVLDKLQERREIVEEEDRNKEQEGVEKVEDELNELLACVEQDSAVDFSVFMQDEDAVNVEEVSRVFADVENIKLLNDSSVEVTSPVDVVDTKQLETQMQTNVAKSWEPLGSFDDAAACQEKEDADNVAMLSEILSATKEDKDTAEPVVASTLTYSLTDCEDAKNVDAVTDLFTSLEKSSDASQEGDRSATQDWIDALEVDNVATLFSELEQAEKMEKTKTKAPVPVKVDSRVFVPTFSVRIEGAQQPGHRPPVGPHSTGLLVGPPGVLLAGPPPPSREERVDRWTSKRKLRSLAARHPDPSISDTRRASAAKRQRVKGRFVSDTHNFVSITALQK